MKVVLICPANKLYMPYIDNYIEILKKNNVNYTIINWDRFGIEKKSDFTYRDKKDGHQRNYFDYYKYSKFICKKLRTNNYDKIIVFGIQLTYFLSGFLHKNYKNKYIIDIRDYNKILKIFNPTRVIGVSAFTTISSPAYKNWLPNVDKYILNHNTSIKNIESLMPVVEIKKDREIIISYIGSLANFQENMEFINALKNNNNIKLMFHGGGGINSEIEKYIFENNITNVEVYGRYDRGQEEKLYNKAHFINMILYNKNINDETCLANRIYKACLYGKPLIAIEGTYLAEIIKKHNLGLVVNSFKDIQDQIIRYLTRFDKEKYNSGRYTFFQNVIKENDYFYKELETFIQDS